MGVHLRGSALVEGWRDGKKLLAIYRGDRLIWDGRVSQYLTMPVARSSSTGLQVALEQSAILEMPRVAGWASMTGDGAVTGSSALTPDVAAADAEAPVPDLVVSSTLTAPAATGTGEASQSAEAISRQEALMFAPRAKADADALDADLIVSSTLTAPTVSSGGEVKGGTYTVSAILEAETAIVYPPTVAETPALSSWHRITADGPAVANVSSVVPSLSAGHVVAAPTVTATGTTAMPEIYTPPGEIMFTVTSLVPVPSTANTTAAITNLSWLPSGPTASTVDLAAGEWVMLTWAVPSGSYPYYRQFGIRRGGVDTWGPVGGSTVNADFNSFLRFTLTTATTVTVIGRATRGDIPQLIKPGDVVAFAPVIS